MGLADKMKAELRAVQEERSAKISDGGDLCCAWAESAGANAAIAEHIARRAESALRVSEYQRQDCAHGVLTYVDEIRHFMEEGDIDKVERSLDQLAEWARHHVRPRSTDGGIV